MHRTARFACSLAAVVAGLVGCSGSPAQKPEPGTANTSVPPLPTSSVATDDRLAVETAYREFWNRLDRVPTLDESQWRSTLTEVAADPQLTITLDALGQQKRSGITGYGTETARILSVDVSGQSATVKDCQDASQSGQADAKTGKPKTVGVPRNPIAASLIRTDGGWKVSQITYPGGTC
ncbi:hypothetical protein [Amycolatopsis sp. NPDC059657]|uniref:hypothetical protein n=1 Tax=Amycolatopsis sp. NPDC059657 TaxID=3346899 RepID=UPI00366C620B